MALVRAIVLTCKVTGKCAKTIPAYAIRPLIVYLVLARSWGIPPARTPIAAQNAL